MSTLSPAQSATLAGSKCSNLKSTKLIANIKYTCIKSKNKLIWDKGTLLSSQTKPTSSPTLKPTATPSPTPSFTPPAEPTSWDNLVNNASGISYWAWKKSADKIGKSESKLGNIKIVISPHAVPDNPTPLVGLSFVSRFAANFEEPAKVQIVYADEKDIDWGQQQIDLFCPQTSCGYNVTGEAKKACNVPFTPCWGGLAVRNYQTNVPMIYVTASDWGKEDANHIQGTLEAHEYFHNIQHILLSKPGQSSVPRWLIEGGATWVAAATVFNGDYSKYLVERERNNADTLHRKKPDAAWLEKFLDPNYNTGWMLSDGSTYDNWAYYDIGALASEILVALKGPDAYMNLYLYVGAGKSFAQAFEEIYGIAWSQGAKLIAQAIVAEQK